MFQKNRERLADKLDNHVLVIAAHSQMQYSADIPYPFRQDSNFWYLTGINEPDLVLLIDTQKGDAVLYLPEQNDYQKLWDGENKGAYFTKISGINQFDSIERLAKRLKEAKKDGKTIGYLAPLPEIVEPYGFYANPGRRRIEQLIKTVESDPKDIRAEIARMRQVKQPHEIEAIRSAVAVTAKALADVKRTMAIYQTEKDVERALSRRFYQDGADGHAFEPIIASGKNAAIIHYNNNSALIEQNALLLMDVGAAYEGYAADISRVWGIGQLSKRQIEVYEILLDIHQKALSILKPGITIKEFQDKVEKYSRKKQTEIGIISEGIPHGVSHHLGLDVHDAGEYTTPLGVGMVITVEPGIYLPEEGIGVRVEDDVLITKSGIDVLSSIIPRDL